MVDDLKCTCFRLRKTDRQVTRHYEAALSQSGVTIVQFSVLAELQRHSASGITELAMALGTDRTTMTRTLERMQAFGWVEHLGADDGRMRRHQITEAGRSVFAEAASGWRRVESAMARGMGAERLALLWQLLGEAEQAVRNTEGGGLQSALSGRRL